MTRTDPTVSQRARRSRDKGKEGEQKLARWLKTWFPEACRAVRQTVPDPGDIDCTSPVLFWSMKNVEKEQLNPWMAELDRKAGDRIGLLVVKRARHADPGEWWCFLQMRHLHELLFGIDQIGSWGSDFARLELHTIMDLLVDAKIVSKP